jgi:hypothetical protein
VDNNKCHMACVPAAACTLDAANAIAVRCTTADDSVATACAAGFYLAADGTCVGMRDALFSLPLIYINDPALLVYLLLPSAACPSVANALAVVCTAPGNNSVAVACEAGYYISPAGTCAGVSNTIYCCCGCDSHTSPLLFPRSMPACRQ